MYEFKYHRPGTVRQAANLLAKNEDAKVIAGGHTLVPVSRRCSRRNCTSRVRGSIFAETGLPLTIRETLAISTLLICAVAYRRRSDENHSKSHNMGPSGVEQPQPEPHQI